MPQILYTETSVADLREIWDYIAQDNERAAEQLLMTFKRKLQTLATMPEMGKDESDLGDKLRSFPVGSYMLFYRGVENGVLHVRAIHGARDITADYFCEE